MSTLAVATIKSVSSAPPVFQNSSGTEKGQLVRAWCTMKGTGTISIHESFNVSSLTDRTTGTYTVHFTNGFSNDKYVGTGLHSSTSNGISCTSEDPSQGFNANDATMRCTLDNALVDPTTCRFMYSGS
tara:strand:- start:589 stop:972 length:384 start_codon:yes stop_codon:yes gene_type:complete